MSHYRRVYVPGGSYFFTAVTHHREAWFSTQENVNRLREAFRHVKKRHPFAIDAIVILPDHIHTIWRLPDGDADYSLRWRLLKHYVAIKLSNGANNRGEKPLWQRRFWEHVIRDETDWRNHIDYIHYNPVKHGYVATPAQWPNSSFCNAVAKGWYEADWGYEMPDNIVEIDCE